MIIIKDDILPKDQLEGCLHWLGKANWTYGWKSDTSLNFGHWNVDITRTGVRNTTDISEKLPATFKRVWDVVNGEVGGNAKLIRCYSNRHTYGTEGYIHVDTTREEDHTCVIYMNKTWEANWGGETSFYNQDKTEITLSVLPKFGRMVLFKGTVPHCARGLTRICPDVRTTLMFKLAFDPKSVYPAEAILLEFLKKIGADRLPHKHGSLMDHLMRCFQLMKQVGIGDILALAGGLHSVYGTKYFDKPCLSLESTAVSDTFGPEVDRLVRLYATLSVPEDVRPGSRLEEQDLWLMKCMVAANLYDNDALHLYPDIEAFVKEMTNTG